MGPGRYGGGVIPVPSHAARGEAYPAKRAPEGPAQGLEWVGYASGARPGPVPPLRGPVGTLRVPPCTGPSLPGNAASWPIRRELRTISRKLVKTAKCRPNMSKRPVIVPIFKKRLRNSPLEILRFPLFSAFSHKELMVLFCAWDGLYGQNDEVSTMCTPVFGYAKGSHIPPRSPPASWLLVTAPHVLSAVFSTTWLLTGLHLIMTETGFLGH